MAAACLFCEASLEHTFVDLGMSPLCESYLTAEQLNQMEPFYPLHVYVCERCFLVQLQEYVRPERIFNEYAYFSSYSDSWLPPRRLYADMIVDASGSRRDTAGWSSSAATTATCSSTSWQGRAGARRRAGGQRRGRRRARGVPTRVSSSSGARPRRRSRRTDGHRPI